jgi:hypoxanthine-DNA glycosylase
MAKMNRITSFPPIAEKSAQWLILGSIPGVLSLQANQYYAHPRNAFWRIMASLYGFNEDLPYESRAAQLKASGVAVWDVLHSCMRVGSLDSAIENGSRIPNDFALFFKTYPHIKLVGFNGGEAEKSFNQLVMPKLKLCHNLNMNSIRFVRLPSTSPAHALSLEKKVTAWREALFNKE